MKKKVLLVAVVVAAAVSASLAFVSQGVPQYGQCGGQGYTGPTTCAAPYVCTVYNQFYSQCL
jgi:hypothetical protein